MRRLNPNLNLSVFLYVSIQWLHIGNFFDEDIKFLQFSSFLKLRIFFHRLNPNLSVVPPVARSVRCPSREPQDGCSAPSPMRKPTDTGLFITPPVPKFTQTEAPAWQTYITF